MIFNPSPSFILIGILIFVNTSHEAIFSSHNHETRLLHQPRVVSLWSNAGMMDKVDNVLNKFRQYLRSRKRRQLGDHMIDPHTSNKLQATWMDLGNETTHNQALIHWCGNYSKVIFILTRRKDSPSGVISDSKLYRSDNYGKTFAEVEIKEHFDDQTVLKEYVVSPSNKKKVVFMDTYKGSRRIWVSEDEGETYQFHNIPFSMDKIEFHPDKAEWLLGYDKNAQSLYVSTDLGSTWSKLSDQVTKDRFYWYVKGVDVDEDANKIVFFEYRDMRTFPSRTFLLKSCYIPNCTPTPFQKMCDDLQTIDAESLVVQNEFVFVQKTGLLQKFYVSYKRGSFQKAEFPSDGEQINFHVVSSDWSTVVVGVDHNLGATNLYFSDPEGKQFSLSLPDVRNFESKIGDNMAFNVDIHKVAGVRGAFLVNKMGNLFLRSRNYTYLTWDNGKSWRRLLADNTGSSACLKATSGDCHLNLHCAMVQTHSGYYMPGMLSKESVPGLIIAHGSVGITLSDRPSVVSVFVSRDAGASWTQALSGRHLFVMGDHGAMLVAAKMIFKEPITSIQFSKDLGVTWTEHNFTDTPVHPDGLLTEPGEYTHHFTLFTHKNYISNWKIFGIDMSILLSRNCSYPSDFANWTMPPKESSTKCHMGRKDSVMRVHADDCLVGTDYKLKMSHQVCNCTEEDYECGYGYSTFAGGKCISTEPVIDWVDDVPHIVAEEAQKEKCVDGQRKVPTNWRRVPGDQCKNDLPGQLFTFERCEDTAPTEPVKLQLLNSTTSAKVGQGLLITVRGPPNVQWVVKRRSEPPVNVSIKYRKNQNHTVALTTNYPGDYDVRAFYKDKPDIYDDLVVSFWYPIEEVVVVLPPSVAVGSLYNVTALVGSKSGIPVTHSHFGNIHYTWEGDIQGTVASSHTIRMKHQQVGLYNLRVQVRNSVSFKKGSGRVEVKPYVVTLVIPLVPKKDIDEAAMTHDWLKDMENLLLAVLMRTSGFSNLLAIHHFTLGHNWHIFIEPSLPLQAQLIFLPTKKGVPLSPILREQAIDFLQLIQKSPIMINLQGGRNTLTSGSLYIISDNQRYEGTSSTPYAVIIIVVLLSIILVVGVIIAGRRYARNSRWGRYFTMPGPSNMNLPPIIRGRKDDRAPIVEDEFFDDELDNMEDLASGSTDGGTLQFRG